MRFPFDYADIPYDTYLRQEAANKGRMAQLSDNYNYNIEKLKLENYELKEDNKRLNRKLNISYEYIRELISKLNSVNYDWFNYED